MEYHERQEDERKKLNTKVAVNKFLKARVRLRSSRFRLSSRIRRVRGTDVGMIDDAHRSTSSSSGRTRSGTT